MQQCRSISRELNRNKLKLLPYSVECVQVVAASAAEPHKKHPRIPVVSGGVEPRHFLHPLQEVLVPPLGSSARPRLSCSCGGGGGHTPLGGVGSSGLRRLWSPLVPAVPAVPAPATTFPSLEPSILPPHLDSRQSMDATVCFGVIVLLKYTTVVSMDEMRAADVQQWLVVAGETSAVQKVFLAVWISIAGSEVVVRLVSSDRLMNVMWRAPCCHSLQEWDIHLVTTGTGHFTIVLVLVLQVQKLPLF